ncbi:hypothetical protein [Jannaschia donghaensis]|uniref:Uncharacterized protein n=1 Tax=Jannaschia donghaensis TaxID=420998 RepID=A0A0M6YP59_9RHOB|nr:hypothetical protein [Jannaschia donghaensis]CTQ51425.1 hypothetical protein JDO7802_03464 [Jannaschia donghaensis]
MAQDAKSTREDRLKAALKANMGRRKAQKRTREMDADKAQDGPDPDEQEKTNG